MRALVAIVALRVLGTTENIEIELTGVVDAQIFRTDLPIIAVFVGRTATKFLVVHACPRDAAVCCAYVAVVTVAGVLTACSVIDIDAVACQRVA